MQHHLSRLYFLSRGCKQCPIEQTIKPLWANGEEGYFLSAYGSKIKPLFSPAQQKGGHQNKGNRGLIHPNMRHFGNASAHRLMAATYAEEPCPIYFDSKGNPYKGIVHHVIENPYDIRVDNLIWWLTYKQHSVADKRRRALESVLPDMYCVPTVDLKRLQDSRLTSDADFDRELLQFKERFPLCAHTCAQ